MISNQINCLIFTLLIVFTHIAFANDLNDDAVTVKQAITQVLEQPEFQTHRETTRWRYRKTADFSLKAENKLWLPQNLLQLIAQFLELLLWIAAFMIITKLIFRGYQLFERWQKQNIIAGYIATPQVMPLSESLPSDIAHQAWLLWQNGQPQAGLSLLYRGTLATLRQSYALDIQDSTTESECLKLVKPFPNLSVYMVTLIQVWQRLTYAHQLPQEQQVQQLCQEWLQHFATRQS